VQEAALRMLENNLHPDVAERPDDLVVYGGTGKAARNKEALAGIKATLTRLKDDETLLVQSGKAVGVLPSHPEAPRVILANSNLVPHWANWDEFRRLEALGLTMYGQMTAGSWIYIGTQGILQGTYESFVAAKAKKVGAKWVLTAGLGGMGGAQPLAAKIAGLSSITVEVDAARIEKRLQQKYLDKRVDDFAEAVRTVQNAKEPLSVGVCSNAIAFHAWLVAQKIVPDIVTDQTSAHDPLNGYVPDMPLADAIALRAKDPQEYVRRSKAGMAAHVDAMLWMKGQGSETFDYGNNIRAFAKEAGCARAFDIVGFIPLYLRPQFCVGRGPFRWVALSGDPEDIAVTDEAVLQALAKDHPQRPWLEAAKKHVRFQGLPARICWLGHKEREEIGLLFNRLVREGKVKAPIVIGRDHLDCGSVASPNRETEAMKDGSDAIADWPLLNFAINAVNGASWVSFHHGGGVGIGYSLHAGMVIVADGSERQERCLRRVLNSDPAMGVLRHADAGYDDAKRYAEKAGIDIQGSRA
jgi:urocanate hydratase